MLGYTQAIEDEYWGYEERIATETKLQIENMDDDTAPDDWKEKILSIGKEHTCSARFFLMSYLFENADSISEDSPNYIFSYHGKEYSFHMVSAEYARQLPDDERNLYIKLLTLIAAENHADSLKTWKPLMWKAMLRNKKLELLTRQEGFQIAHGLKFSLKQAEKFLLSVLDNDGFCYTRSEDIIEAFCFLYNPANNWHTAQSLKEIYQQKTQGILKKEAAIKPDDFTKSISVSLPDRIEEWNRTADEDTIDQFMNWLISQAPKLDIPSRSAYTLYRRLTAFAYETTLSLSADIDNDIADSYHLKKVNVQETYGDGFADDIREHCFNNEYDLKENDIYKVASTLLNFASLEFDNKRNRIARKVWRYLTINDNGKVTAKAIGSRIPDLLSAAEAVTKADMLFMLWYICDLFWMAYDNESELSLYDRLSGFWSLAEDILEEAMLPPFYAPHMLERSFLNSICTGTITEESPFEVYEGMCEFVLPEKMKRNRVKKSDEKETKKSRAKLEKKTEELYNAGLLKFDDLESIMVEHFLIHASEKGKYVFTADGIYYVDPKAAILDPNMPITIPYPDVKTGLRFDMSRDDYNNEESMEERFQFLYGLSLYLMDNATTKYYESDFRTNYRKNATLSVIKWEKTSIK